MFIIMQPAYYHGTDAWLGLFAIKHGEIRAAKTYSLAVPIHSDFYLALPLAFKNLSAHAEMVRELSDGGLILEFELSPDDERRVQRREHGTLWVPEKVSLQQLKVVHFTPRTRGLDRLIINELDNKQSAARLHFMSEPTFIPNYGIKAYHPGIWMPATQKK